MGTNGHRKQPMGTPNNQWAPQTTNGHLKQPMGTAKFREIARGESVGVGTSDPPRNPSTKNRWGIYRGNSPTR